MNRRLFESGNSKLRLLRTRGRFFLKNYPVRLHRIGLHFKKGLTYLRQHSAANKSLWALAMAIAMWWVHMLFLTMDILVFPEVYETLTLLVKYKTRRLTEVETKLARTVLGNAIDYEAVLVDEHAFLGCKQGHFLYVSFHTINGWGGIDSELLMHELVHVWQYEQLGSRYIPLALQAQFSPQGYDYGGLNALLDYLKKGNSLKDFNLEQQAEIVTDFFRIMTDKKPRWGLAGVQDLSVYRHFLKELSAG
ncbi:MAG: hypothetical protein EPO28_08415 [Saprospiraceae bacterium]|nr:MAG: hypothetical protein EPO28_08415 [Saprospiraceae bacterium]